MHDLLELPEVNADLFEQAMSLRTHVVLFEVDAPSEAKQHPAAGVELVALGVPTEVVVIVENQDLRIVAGAFPVEVRGSQTADPSAHDHEVVLLVQGVVPVGTLSAPGQGM